MEYRGLSSPTRTNRLLLHPRCHALRSRLVFQKSLGPGVEVGVLARQVKQEDAEAADEKTTASLSHAVRGLKVHALLPPLSPRAPVQTQQQVEQEDAEVAEDKAEGFLRPEGPRTTRPRDFPEASLSSPRRLCGPASEISNPHPKSSAAWAARALPLSASGLRGSALRRPASLLRPLSSAVRPPLPPRAPVQTQQHVEQEVAEVAVAPATKA